MLLHIGLVWHRPRNIGTDHKRFGTDPGSSNGRGGAAKQATTTVSDLGTERGERKDLGEVSRG
jgi:hypothetical protein